MFYVLLCAMCSMWRCDGNSYTFIRVNTNKNNRVSLAIFRLCESINIFCLHATRTVSFDRQYYLFLFCALSSENSTLQSNKPSIFANTESDALVSWNFSSISIFHSIRQIIITDAFHIRYSNCTLYAVHRCALRFEMRSI